MSDFEKGLPSKKEINEISDLREEAFRAIIVMRERGRQLYQRLEKSEEQIATDAIEDEIKDLEEISTGIMDSSAQLTDILQRMILHRKIKPTQADAADLAAEMAEMAYVLEDIKTVVPIGPIMARYIDADIIDGFKKDNFTSSKPDAHWLDKFSAMESILEVIINTYIQKRAELLPDIKKPY